MLCIIFGEWTNFPLSFHFLNNILKNINLHENTYFTNQLGLSLG